MTRSCHAVYSWCRIDNGTKPPLSPSVFSVITEQWIYWLCFLLIITLNTGGLSPRSCSHWSGAGQCVRTVCTQQKKPLVQMGCYWCRWHLMGWTQLAHFGLYWPFCHKNGLIINTNTLHSSFHLFSALIPPPSSSCLVLVFFTSRQTTDHHLCCDFWCFNVVWNHLFKK